MFYCNLFYLLEKGKTSWIKKKLRKPVSLRPLFAPKPFPPLIFLSHIMIYILEFICLHVCVCRLLCGSKHQTHISACINLEFHMQPHLDTKVISLAFWPTLPFIISTIALELVQSKLPLFQSPPFCLPWLNKVSSFHCRNKRATTAQWLACWADLLFMQHVEGLNLTYPALFSLSFFWKKTFWSRWSSLSLSSIPSPPGSLGHHRWFCNQFPPFFPVFHCSLGLEEH